MNAGTRLAILTAAVGGLWLHAQPGAAPPPEIYTGIVRSGPIVIGTITAVLPGASPYDGKLQFDVREQLRGEPVDRALTLAYKFVPPDPRRPSFAWQRVPPAAGKNLLLFLGRQSPQDDWQAVGILDLGAAEGAALPLVRRGLEMEQAAGRGEKPLLFNSLADPTLFIRGLAVEFLTARACANDAPCRREMLTRAAAMAGDAARPLADRIWAVNVISAKVYAGFRAGDEVDREAAHALAGLLGDPNMQIRGEAVQFLHGLLLGVGSVKPDVRLPAAQRTRAVDQMRRDAASAVPFAAQARDLARVLSAQQQ